MFLAGQNQVLGSAKQFKLLTRIDESTREEVFAIPTQCHA